MSRLTRHGVPVFLVLGIACLAVGMSGTRAFWYIGLAFIAIGVVALVRNSLADKTPKV